MFKYFMTSSPVLKIQVEFLSHWIDSILSHWLTINTSFAYPSQLIYFSQVKKTGIDLLFRKYPENIIRGTRIGALRASAALTEGADADIKEPNETAELATNTRVRQQNINRMGSLFKFDIQ